MMERHTRRWSPQRTLIAFGSNVGDRAGWLRFGVLQVASLPGVTWRAGSSLYETDPVGGPPQDHYLNAVAAFDVALDPADLLAACLQIEHAAGRIRSVPNGPRTLDIDLILVGEHVRGAPDPVLPHPRLEERAFVLIPADEIASDWTVPGDGRTIAELRRPLGDPSSVRLVGPPRRWL